ncbi:MAG: tyrosine-type recombinase/integrase [Pseudomonadota bacterium]
MKSVKIRLPNNTTSWTVIDHEGNTVDEVRDWINHLEETNMSPNTIKAYSRHVARLGGYLYAHSKTFKDISVVHYDGFLKWLPWAMSDNPLHSENVLAIHSCDIPQVSASLKNQVHLSVKSFYRYLNGREAFNFTIKDKHRAYDGQQAYKPFLDHINQRNMTRKKDKYLNGDTTKVRKKISDYRLTPDEVLILIKNCHLMRDSFLIVLLYNTGIRIGEALGVRHSDIDVTNKIIWIVPRSDNENGARAKSGRTRAIPVNEYVINMYEDFITSNEYSDAFESGTSYVFCNVKKGKIGRALSLSYAGKLNRYLVKRCGIQFSWHIFRHTHASEAIAEGHSLLEIAERLGHVSPKTTVDFYQHLFSSEVRKLYLTGPDKLKKRLEELSEAALFEKDLKWI